jgi:hypothetical protein
VGSRRYVVGVAAVSLAMLAACGRGTNDGTRDAEAPPADAGIDASIDASMDEPIDASMDEPADAASDTGTASDAGAAIDAPLAPTDAEPDAGPDANCTPRTCHELGFDCGDSSDGCGGTLSCGTCAPPSTCSGGGAYHVCGTFPADGGGCLPDCAELPVAGSCAQLSDGCGHLIGRCGTGFDCSLSPYGTCGGDGIPYVCSGRGLKCKPVTCADLNYDCGEYGNGCGGGGILECGTCVAPAFCGGGGYNRCGPSDAEVDAGN